MLTPDSEFTRLTRTANSPSLPILPVNREPWVVDAECGRLHPYAIDEIFFVDKGLSYKHARKICYRCPVRRECAEYALTTPHDLDGYWGGMSKNERKRLRSILNIEAVQETIVVSIDTDTDGSFDATVEYFSEEVIVEDHFGGLGTDD